MERDYSITSEGEREEHKEVANDKLFSEAMETVCGFLNSSGGKVILGVNKDGQPVGLTGDLDSVQQKIFNELRNHFKPSPHPNVQVTEKDNLIYCFVESGSEKMYQYRNVCFKRTGSSTHALTYEETKAAEDLKTSGIKQIAPDIFTNRPGPEAWCCDTCGGSEVSAFSVAMFIGAPPENPNAKPCSNPSCTGTMRRRT